MYPLHVFGQQDSPSENVINWDIKRTYVGHDYFQDGLGKDALYKISKAYSVYDEEVGYCQGFSFMAAVLLLQVGASGGRRGDDVTGNGLYGGSMEVMM